MKKSFLALFLCFVSLLMAEGNDAVKGLITEANSLIDGQKYEEALVKLADAEKLAPAERDVFRYKGYCLKMLKKYEEAIAAYAKCAEIDPAFEKAYLNQGDCYLELQQAEKAISLYDKALENKKDDSILPIIYSGKIRAFTALGKTAEVESVLTQLIAANPAAGYSTAANVSYQNREYAKAAEAYKKVTELVPENAGAFYNGACSYALNNDSVNALLFLEKALVIDKKLTAEGKGQKLLEQAVNDADFATVKNLPEFSALIEKVQKN